VTGLLFACVQIEPYEECGFPPQQKEQCFIKNDGTQCKKTSECPGGFVCEATEEQGVKRCVDPALKSKSSSNCVVKQAQCPEGFCVSFHGSSGFCSEECDPNAPDCPEGGSCEKFAFGCGTDAGCTYLCVKASLVK